MAATTLIAGVAALGVWSRFSIPISDIPLRDEYASRLAALNVGDGVDADEAEEIAGLYMLEYIGGCGAPMTPELRDGTWTAQLRLGFAGEVSDRVVQIDRTTGAVSSSRGPRFPIFRAFRDDLVGGMALRRRSTLDSE